ncbi:DMT family transporter [Pleomorphomonas carboxyditropha]|uniref:EamA family transporter n=1 Tax=Pleomorphomonas carboxyditropha TaxID=2023338 RepID=A0A2G9WWC4_9HYPH|nr:DMT family transporter [Pleomorphomonas carboxyditropha]PIO98998.1 EamA family transporter [Pleomorphomonas carboxyditropha]
MNPSSPSAGSPWLGYGFAALGAVLFAAKGILIKLAFAEGVDTLTLLALRMGLSVPIYVAVGFAAYARERHRLVPMPAYTKALLIGVIGYWFSSYADFKGLETLTPQFERLILFTYPLFVLLLGAALFRMPLRWKPLAAFGVAYIGLAVIFLADFESGGGDIVVGALWVLAAAVTFALYQLLATGSIATLGAPLFTSVAMTGAAVVVLALFLVTHPLSALVVSGRAFALAATLAIGATVLPSFLMSAALSRISAAANSTIGTLSPVVTLFLAVLILDEPVRGVDLLGTALVVGGVGLFTIVDRRR